MLVRVRQHDDRNEIFTSDSAPNNPESLGRAGRSVRVENASRGLLTLANGYASMAAWLIRAGKHGEEEELALTVGRAIIGWVDVPSLKKANSRENIAAMLKAAEPQAKAKRIQNQTAQLWAFLRTIKKGDLVALPLKTRAAVAIGEVAGDYEFAPIGSVRRHTRAVKWLRTDIPRAQIPVDLLRSLGASQTVCQVQRNNAEKRLRALAANPSLKLTVPEGEGAEEEFAAPDYERQALDEIVSHIREHFKTHELERLIEAILKAQGYVTLKTTPGRDGGIDIVAGRGPLGFEGPRVGVQVKSSAEPVGVSVIRELQGVLKEFRADHGLVAAWGGYNSEVLKEARKRFFEIRLWDQDDIVTNLLESYERLPKDIQAEIPLRRIWTLVRDEEDSA